MYKIETISQKDFPPQLFEIPEPPKSLHIAGTLPPPDAIFLAIVGSRRYTEYGKAVCEKIISGLAGSSLVIVSGLALGIDGIAHEAALKHRLTTVAFPGSGLSSDVLYPRIHLSLAEKIIKSGGALISEFEDNFKATPYSFPQRNRLMAGISRGILIVEAEEKSGTLITARLGTEYNRDVFAIPGSIFSIGSVGTNRLIKEGAIPVTSGGDILKQWGLQNNETQTIHIDDLSEHEKRIIELLNEPMTKDELIVSLELPIHEANIALGTLEIRGVIEQSMGKIKRLL